MKNSPGVACIGVLNLIKTSLCPLMKSWMQFECVEMGLGDLCKQFEWRLVFVRNVSLVALVLT